ncbi:GNAT family N-acetyltransferase [Agrobacterium leguminum]|uniref:GNAT family N-acetyltransferase n=1 Tax=Agrobacterium leguminum TaxID=2792015 RepID=UPI003CE4647C
MVDRSASIVLGQAALIKFSAEHRSVEIGYVLFLPSLQRTREGKEALFLLMRHVFETMKLRRCEWRCDSRNIKSERAALRLGFRLEGRFQHGLPMRISVRMGLLKEAWKRSGFRRKPDFPLAIPRTVFAPRVVSQISVTKVRHKWATFAARECLQGQEK